MTREEKLEAVVKIFSKCMFYGDWKWETPNERTIEMLMTELGYFPYKNEDDMIAKSFVSEELYIKARNLIPIRNIERSLKYIAVICKDKKDFELRLKEQKKEFKTYEGSSKAIQNENNIYVMVSDPCDMKSIDFDSYIETENAKEIKFYDEIMLNIKANLKP